MLWTPGGSIPTEEPDRGDGESSASPSRGGDHLAAVVEHRRAPRRPEDPDDVGRPLRTRHGAARR